MLLCLQCLYLHSKRLWGHITYENLEFSPSCQYSLCSSKGSPLKGKQSTGPGVSHQLLSCPGDPFEHAKPGACPVEGHLKGPSFCVTCYSGLVHGYMNQTSSRGPTFIFRSS